MDSEARMTSEVLRLWNAAAGMEELARWENDEDGSARVRAQRSSQVILRATASTVPWNDVEKVRHDGPESLLGIIHQAIARRENDERLFRLAIYLEKGARYYSIVLRVEWASPPRATLPDHDDVARAVEQAGARVRAIVESPRFGGARLEDVRGLHGIEATAIDPGAAFRARCHADDEDPVTNRLEQALGTLNRLVYARPDYRVWSDRLREVGRPALDLAAARLGVPWGHEVDLDLRMILISRAFPRSEDRKVEALRPLMERIETVLSAGGLVYGLRGRRTETAVVLACPGPLATA